MAIRYFALLLICGGAVYFSLDYAKLQKRRARVYSVLLKFLLYIEAALDTSPMPLADMVRDFECEERERELISHIALGTPLGDMPLGLDGADEGRLREYFASLGDGYLELERQKCKTAISSFKPINERVASECEKNVKLSAVLSASLIGGILLVFL